MKFVPSRIERERAADLLRGSWLPGLREAPRKLEQVLLPYYVLEIRCRDAQGREHPLRIAGDGLLGEFVILDTPDEELVETPPAELLPFAIEPDEARERGLAFTRDLLLGESMRERQLLEALEVTSLTRIGYPYWVRYYKRWGRYGFRILDAVTGKLERGRGRRSFAKALLAPVVAP